MLDGLKDMREKRQRSDEEMREEGRRVGGVGKREKGRMVKLLQMVVPITIQVMRIVVTLGNKARNKIRAQPQWVKSDLQDWAWPVLPNPEGARYCREEQH